MMGIKTTDQFPIKTHYYYLVSFKIMMVPKVMPVYFPTRNTAKRVLVENVPSSVNRKKYSVYKGKKIKEMKLDYLIGSGNFFKRGGKYVYPSRKMTPQERKSYRTLHRRRLRRMNLLTTNKAKFNYREKVKKVKVKKNFQKVAKSPNTDAKCFWLERGSRHTWYIVLKKQPSEQYGKLFKIRAIRINTKTGVWKKVTIHIRSNDIIHAELLRNLQSKANAQAGLRAYTRYCQKQQEKVLQKSVEELRKRSSLIG